jgi:hypothetical protein
MIENKMYLGDGVYADFDGYRVILTAENGVSVQHKIYLDDSVVKAFFAYIKRIQLGKGGDEDEKCS